MFFAILGKNKDISLKELEFLEPTNIEIDKNLVFFDTKFPERLKLLAGITKFGKVFDFEYLGDILFGKDLVGVKTQEFGIFLKKNFGVKRFKIIDEIKTDLEIKEKGVEIFNIDKQNIGIVQGYQNISLYENIDFEKPVSGMQIGMMPSKLAHIMINIGLSNIEQKENITIYDPFVGFGTTGFLANYLGYDFIGSDINITPFKQNLKRWKESSFLQNNRLIDFKRDINTPFQKSFLKNVNLIVTEGWLGPLITHKTRLHQQQQNFIKILDIYKNFIQNVNDFYDQITCVFTVPVYFGKDFYAVDYLKNFCHRFNLDCQVLDEIYMRTGQTVGRAIFVVTKK